MSDNNQGGGSAQGMVAAAANAAGGGQATDPAASESAASSGGDTSGGASGQTAANGGASGAVADAAGAQDKASGPYRPEGLADHLYGETDQDTIDKLMAAYGGARKKLSERGQGVPENADGYELKLEEGFTEKYGKIPADDRMLTFTKKWAHEHGISNDAFNGLVNSVFREAIDAGALEAPMTQEKFLEQLGGPEAGAQQINDAAAYLRNMRDQKVFGEFSGDLENPKEGDILYQEALVLANISPNAVKVMNALRKAGGSSSFETQQGDVDTTGGSPTLEQLQKMQADPKYDSLSAQFDRAYREKVDNLFLEYEKGQN